MYPVRGESTISRWMYQEAEKPVHFPEGLVSSVIKNEQLVRKSHRAKADNKLPTSVITIYLYVILDEHDRIQNEEEFGILENEDEIGCLVILVKQTETFLFPDDKSDVYEFR